MKKSAIKVLALVLLAAALLLAMSGFTLKSTYSFSYARIYTPDGQILVEGKVFSWRWSGDSDQLEIVIDKTAYLAHASLVILSAE